MSWLAQARGTVTQEHAPLPAIDPLSRIWSSQQEEIFQFAVEESGHLVVRARAGTGKTTTIVEAVKRYSAARPSHKVVLCAFNKRIVDELVPRVGGTADVKTLHALGYGLVRRYWSGVRVCEGKARQEALTLAAVGKGCPSTITKLISKLHTLAREVNPHATLTGLEQLAMQFDCEPDEYWTNYEGYDLDYVCQAAFTAMNLAAATQPKEGIDFADMIYLPVHNHWMTKEYDLVVVDEAQDMTMSQLTIAQGVCKGALWVVGDDKQCQPAGTQVRVSKTESVPIESLAVGDTVVTFDRHSQAFIGSGKVTEIGCRRYKGLEYTVEAGGHRSRCTDSHKWLVRWVNKHQDVWVTYLMQKGNRFRVGQTRLFQRTGRGTTCGVSQRVRVERAEAAWILGIHDSIESSLEYEQIIAARFGLPEMVFYPPSGIKYFTQGAIDRVYSALGDLTDNAQRCLEAHNRKLEYPFYIRNKRLGRQTLFETQACNLIPHYMAVAVAPERLRGYDKPHRFSVSWGELALEVQAVDAFMYSLNVAKHHKYIADGLVTCNSIYGFRGADSGSLDRLKSTLNATELGLTTTYRCGKRIVTEAQRLVPSIQAGVGNSEGSVTTLDREKLVAEAQLGDFILSRLNAPLVGTAMALLRAGKRTRVAGRDIGQGLKGIIRTVGKSAKSVPELLTRVTAWEVKQVTRATKMKWDSRVDQIHDQAETIRHLATDADSMAHVEQRIDALFEDDGLGDAGMITCSSVHKAKGLEADKVFVLAWTLRDRDQEELNIQYVAITRARHTLVFVN